MGKEHRESEADLSTLMLKDDAIELTAESATV